MHVSDFFMCECAWAVTAFMRVGEKTVSEKWKKKKRESCGLREEWSKYRVYLTQSHAKWLY